MKAFFVGLLCLLMVAVFSAVGVLLFPLFLVMALLLRVLLAFVFILLCIWLLGKFIIFIWEKLRAGK